MDIRMHGATVKIRYITSECILTYKVIFLRSVRWPTDGASKKRKAVEKGHNGRCLSLRGEKGIRFNNWTYYMKLLFCNFVQ